MECGLGFRVVLSLCHRAAKNQKFSRLLKQNCLPTHFFEDHGIAGKRRAVLIRGLQGSLHTRHKHAIAISTRLVLVY